MARLFKLAILPAVLVLIASVKSDLPIDTEFLSEISDNWRNTADDAMYRLPESLDPRHYDVEITPYFEATDTRPAFSFDGIVTIVVTAKEDGISSLILQENVREILGLTVLDETGAPLRINRTHPFERIREYQFLKINLEDGVTLVNGQNYVIRVLYLGHMNETPLSRGVFRGNYIGDDNKTYWYAATHLQPTHSRQAFPSFDEPGFKSTFTIIINRLDSYKGTYSNMRRKSSTPIGNNRVKDVFITTPKMSAYLVTFHISEEFTVIADNNDEERSYRIIARPNARGQGEYALKVGPPLTKWLEEYLGVPYYAMGEQMKNDQLATPFWASGATENWGLVSYRELRLLYEEGETNDVDKLNIGTITSHELAHKWFGNLVTARWWNNVWINEGYASYFENFALDGVYPEFELADQFIITTLQNALSSDSSAATRALEHTVNSPGQVTGHFSGISYTKGASLLLMLKHFLTEPTFRKALNYYLKEMSYNHAFPVDIFRGFEKAVQEDEALSQFPDVNITKFMDYWVHEPGYPVLNVEVDTVTGVISLSQERFFINSGSSEQVWPLPLTYTTGNSPNWNNVRATHVMTEKTRTLAKQPGSEWVIFNVQQTGFYRVNYDQQNWALIAEALKANSSIIHHLNKAQIVDDVFALMRSGRMSYTLGFQVLDFLKQETNYFVWYPAITGFTWLRNRIRHLPDELAQFDAILLGFLEAVVANVGFDTVASEPLTSTLKRFYILALACNIGHGGCIQDSVSKYTALLSGTSVNPNIRRHVFCSGLREGGYNEWKFLQNRFLNSNNQADELVMLRALGCSSNENAVQEYLEMILTDTVKAQDRPNCFIFIFMGNSTANPKLVWNFIKTRHVDIKEVVGGDFNNIILNMASYMDEEALQEMEDWLNANKDTFLDYTASISAVNSARNSLQWGNERAQEILKAARGYATAVVPSMLALFAVMLVTLLK